jgi:hypothetical protein
VFDLVSNLLAIQLDVNLLRRYVSTLALCSGRTKFRTLLK